MISVHKNKAIENKQEITSKVINDFVSVFRDDFSYYLLTTFYRCFLTLFLFVFFFARA